MSKVYEYDESTVKLLKEMVPSEGNSVENAIKKQSQFARAVGKQLNDIIFQAKRQPTIDLADIAQKVQKGEQVLTLAPTKPVIYPGDIVTDIFSINEIPGGTVAEYPVEMAGDTDYIAVEIPDDGRLPERLVVADSTFVRTFEYGNSVTWKQSYALNGNVVAIAKAKKMFMAGFLKKMNDIGWHAVMGAAAERNLVVTDPNAPAGTFTRPLLTAMMRQMRRQAGGNAASGDKFRLTDVFVSLEAMEDILLWDTDDVNALSVFETLVEQGYATFKIHGVRIHVMDELGVGQEYQSYLADTLGVSLGTGDQEFCIGLDLTKDDTFVMPISQRLQVIPMTSLIERQRMGLAGWMNLGAAVLDARAVILGSF